MLELAGANNPTAHFRKMDCRDIGTLPGKYNAIVCGFCLPYLSKREVRQLFEDAATLLSPQGSIYVSSMEGDYADSGFSVSSSGDKMYIFYHQVDYLTKWLEQSGFQNIDIDRQELPNQDGPAKADLLIVATK